MKRKIVTALPLIKKRVNKVPAISGNKSGNHMRTIKDCKDWEKRLLRKTFLVSGVKQLTNGK